MGALAPPPKKLPCQCVGYTPSHDGVVAESRVLIGCVDAQSRLRVDQEMEAAYNLDSCADLVVIFRQILLWTVVLSILDWAQACDFGIWNCHNMCGFHCEKLAGS